MLTGNVDWISLCYLCAFNSRQLSLSCSVWGARVVWLLRLGPRLALPVLLATIYCLFVFVCIRAKRLRGFGGYTTGYTDQYFINAIQGAECSVIDQQSNPYSVLSHVWLWVCISEGVVLYVCAGDGGEVWAFVWLKGVHFNSLSLKCRVKNTLTDYMVCSPWMAFMFKMWYIWIKSFFPMLVNYSGWRFGH